MQIKRDVSVSDFFLIFPTNRTSIQRKVQLTGGELYRMHGELPQELSVAAIEVLGTGTGQAEGNKYKD